MTIIIGARLSDDLAVIVADQLISGEEGPRSKHSKDYEPKIQVGLNYVVGACGDAECCDIFLEGCRSLSSFDEISHLYSSINESFVTDATVKLSKLQQPFNIDDYSCDAIVAFGPDAMYELSFASKPRLVRDYAVMGIGEITSGRYLKQLKWRSYSIEQRLLHVLSAYNYAITQNLYCDGVPTIHLIDSFTRAWREDTGTLALRIATCAPGVISDELKEKTIASMLFGEPVDVLEFAEKAIAESFNCLAARRHLYGFSSGKVT